MIGIDAVMPPLGPGRHSRRGGQRSPDLFLEIGDLRIVLGTLAGRPLHASPPTCRLRARAPGHARAARSLRRVIAEQMRVRAPGSPRHVGPASSANRAIDQPASTLVTPLLLREQIPGLLDGRRDPAPRPRRPDPRLRHPPDAPAARSRSCSPRPTRRRRWGPPHPSDLYPRAIARRVEPPPSGGLPGPARAARGSAGSARGLRDRPCAAAPASVIDHVGRRRRLAPVVVVRAHSHRVSHRDDTPRSTSRPRAAPSSRRRIVSPARSSRKVVTSSFEHVVARAALGTARAGEQPPRLRASRARARRVEVGDREDRLER